MVKTAIVINATISIFLIVTFIFIGLIMFYKYIKFKNKALLYMGLTWIGLSQSWLGSAITVFLVVLNPASNGLSPEAYIILSTCLIPLTTPLYVFAMTDMVMKKYKTILRVITIVYSAFYEILMFTLIFTANIHLMIIKTSPAEIQITLLTIILLLYFMIIFLVLGFVFCYQSLKVDDQEIRLKGKILLFSYILFLVGNLLEQIQIIALQRILLIISAIGFYIGYNLPSWIKRLFLKNKMEQSI